jgi:hypothetical protein
LHRKQGDVGSNEPGFLYMTFRLLREESEPAKELTYEQILDCVHREKDRLNDLPKILNHLLEICRSPLRQDWRERTP